MLGTDVVAEALDAVAFAGGRFDRLGEKLIEVHGRVRPETQTLDGAAFVNHTASAQGLDSVIDSFRRTADRRANDLLRGGEIGSIQKAEHRDGLEHRLLLGRFARSRGQD